MPSEQTETQTLAEQILRILQEHVAQLAHCTPEEVGTGDVKEVGIDSRPMLFIVAHVEVQLGHEGALQRDDIKPEVLTNLLVLADRLAKRIQERKE